MPSLPFASLRARFRRHFGEITEFFKDFRGRRMQYLGIEPGYDSLRSEPRFQDLMRKVGLPQ